MPTAYVKVDPSGAKAGARVVKREFDGMTSSAKKTDQAVDKLGKTTTSSMAKASTGAKAFGAQLLATRASAVALGVALSAAVAKGFSSAKGLDNALAEASTLLEGTTAEMSLMRKEAISMAAEFGGGATAQVEAFYQAISAGAGGVEGAAKLLQTSNQLAKGGVSDITTSVDVLTSVMNAYGTGVESAADISDVLFTGVKAGKTTIDELGAKIGSLLPLTTAMGVNFDESVAAVAALTATGQSTSLAVTGMNAAFASILKPTKEAEEAADRLGIEFNATGLASKGLSGFLEDLFEKTNGSADAIGELFGSQEALKAILTLNGEAGDKFIETLIMMENRSGATAEAVRKMSEALSDRLDVSLAKVGIAFQALGTVLLNVVVPALEAVVWVGEKVVTAVSQIVTWLNMAWESSVTFKALVIALAGAITASLIPAILTLGSALVALAVNNPFTAIALAVTVAGVTLINFINKVGGVATAWALMRDVAIEAWGRVQDQFTIVILRFQAMTFKMKALWFSFIKAIAGKWGEFVTAIAPSINKMSAVVQSEFRLSNVAALTFASGMESASSNSTLLADAATRAADKLADLSGAPLESVEAIGAAFEDVARIAATDPLEAFGGAGAPVVPPTPANDPAAPSGGAGGTADTTRAAFDSLRASLDETFASQMAFADGQRIVNEALAAGTIDTATATNALGMLKDEFELATDAGRQMQESLADSISQSMGDALMSVVDGTKTVGEAFRTMALAIARELFQVIVIEQMVLALKTAIGGFGDGGLFNGGSVVPSANGNLFSGGNVVPFADGGVVSTPTLFPMTSGVGLMGEAGPEAIMPLSRGADGKLGVKAAGGGSSQAPATNGDVSIINILDPSIVGQYMDTPEGRRAIVNIIEEERAA